ncbi:ABC transporter permease [Cellulomonas wangsupingiae]|uniref:ABC transporter permease n=1 Tax=Cellulomonas wangsupingiae TaxID=2968085 RepID=A0ABY5K7L5_9CELL|nr:ABC transporter permease [Cellulomonas wangsupingiae]MCC2334373.1 ABC transporter permease [Cellulomonas wangsupingiae]MCM0640754.1 ABC transporter permease [Cellulomonas wangsupingiae]UUI66043.1 ABC transporter permease [Cellulomonas wangsupingiae]
MSTDTTPRTAHAQHRTASTARLTPWHVLRSEWIKIWTLRSTLWTIGLTVAVLVLLAWAMAASAGIAPGQFEGGAGSASMIYLLLAPGQIFGSLVLVVLAALSITGEYGTGQVRSTFAAVPTRLPVLWAKGVVVALLTFATAAVGTALSLLLAGAIEPTMQPDWSDPEMLRIVVGTPLYIATVALLGFALGALMRNTAATIATVIGFVLVVESVLNLISWKPLEYVRPFLPSSAGARVATPEEFLDMTNQMATQAVDLSPWGGYAVLVGWVVVILGAGALRLRTRDV